MKIFLIILAVLIILLLVILLCPITVFIKKNQKEKMLIRAKFLFLSFNLDEKASSKKEKKKAVKKNEAKEKLSFTQKVKHYSNLLTKVLSCAGELLSHIRIKNLYLKLICAEGDAAFTAISYGAVCSVVYPLLGILENKTKVDKGAFDLNIWCDYNTGKSEYAFNITFSAPLISALIIGIKVYLKLKHI